MIFFDDFVHFEANMTTKSGIFIVNDAATGYPQAIICDNNYLTARGIIDSVKNEGSAIASTEDGDEDKEDNIKASKEGICALKAAQHALPSPPQK